LDVARQELDALLALAKSKFNPKTDDEVKCVRRRRDGAAG